MRLRTIFAAAVATLALCAASARAEVTVIRAGKLVAPETGTTAVNQTIIVEGEKITAVGANLPVPAGAKALATRTTDD